MSQAISAFGSAGRPGGSVWRELAAPIAVVTVLAVATATATLASNGNFIATIAPVVIAGVLWAIWVAPFRVTLGLTMLLALVADRPGDAEGKWASPLNIVGELLFHNLHSVTGITALKFSGVFALVCYLLVIRAYRVLVGRSRDTAGSVRPAGPMLWTMAWALAALVFVGGMGLSRGGDVEMVKIQVQGFLQLLAVAYLFSVSMRGPRDYQWLGTIIVAAACIKAAMALWVRATLPAAFPDQYGIMRELDYATNHGDSMVFACAIAALIGPLFHQPTHRHISRFFLAAPLILAGVYANDRRLAWVELALVLTTFILMNPKSVFTRKTAKIVMLLSPLLALYTAGGMFSASRIFAPVAFIRTLVQPERIDGSLDRSTLFRDVENFNLVNTFIPNPVLGTGLGRPFVQAAQGDDLSHFKEYFFLPHNSVLGLWAFGGLLGFSAIMSTVVAALFLSARSHARAISKDHAIAAAAAIGCLLSYLVQLWGDIGFTEPPTIFLVGLAFAASAQVATATGAWPSGGRQRVTHNVSGASS